MSDSRRSIRPFTVASPFSASPASAANGAMLGSLSTNATFCWPAVTAFAFSENSR